MFERFTDRARRVVVLAQEEARMLNHNYIGTEHILLGLIHEGEGVAAKALESLGISLEAVRQQVGTLTHTSNLFLTEGGVRLAGTVIPLPAAVRTAASQAGLREIVLGIRPEHLHLANGSGPVAGEVMLVEELGADALLHVRLAEDHNLVVARTEGRKPPAPGQQVTFSVQPDDVFAFQPETGARLAG